MYDPIRDANMSEHNKYLLINEDDYTTSELITLWTLLINKVEKDIDDLKTNRLGFTPWQIMVSIAGVIVGILTALKEITNPFTSITLLVFLLTTFAIQFVLFAILLSSSATKDPVKPGRVYYYRERFYGLILSFIFNLLVLIGLIVVVIGSSLVGGVRIGILVSLFLSSFLWIVSIYAYVRNRETGNNPFAPFFVKVFWHWLMIANSLIIVSICAYQAIVLYEPAFTNTYVFSGFLAILVFLLGLLITSLVSPGQITLLNDLRDNILFRRFEDLNNALLTYRQIKEGKLSLEAGREDRLKFGAALENMRILLATKKEELEKIRNRSDKSKKSEYLLETRNSLAHITELFDKATAGFLDRCEYLAKETGDYVSEEIVRNDVLYSSRHLKDEFSGVLSEINALIDGDEE